MHMKNKFIHFVLGCHCFLLSLAFATSALDNLSIPLYPTSTTENPLASTLAEHINQDQAVSPWSVTCDLEQRFNVRLCTAKQTQHHDIGYRETEATLILTPSRTQFETKHIVDRHKHAKFVIGPKKKWFPLYTNCYQEKCLLFPESNAQNKLIIQKMKENEQCELHIIDSKTHERVVFVFDLKDFSTVYEPISQTHQKIETYLQQHSNGFVSSKKLTK